MFFYDYYYLILVLPMIIFSLIAQGMVKSAYGKYGKIQNMRRITGADAALSLLHAQGVYDVRVERINGTLTDHYDPKANVIRLSADIFDSSSIAAVGIACHEAGHAMQYHSSYLPVKIRMAIIPVCNAASKISIPLIIVGLILGAFASNYVIAYLGVIAFAVATLFELVTLPVEFNASKRAIQAIKEGNFLYDDEVAGAKSVLRAAALTYVAALAVSLANLLRFVLIIGGRDNRR